MPDEFRVREGITHRSLTVLMFLALFLNGSSASAETARKEAENPLHRQIDALIAFGDSEPVHAARTDDAEFLRRVWLDLAGTIPSADTVRRFLADESPDKRQRVIDDLLTAPTWPKRMANLFHVVLMERRGDDQEWQAWLTRSFEQNKPWNQLVREVLNPDADDEGNRAAAYFMTRRLEKYGQNPIDYPGLVRDIGRMFLGQDLQCAECHDHLFIDDYKQLDFQGLFAVYQNTFIRRDVKFPAIGEKAMTAPVEFASVFDPTKQTTGPRLPGGTSFEIPIPKPTTSLPPKKKQPPPPRPEWSAVELLAQELTRDENRQFARTAVNRLWYVLMGRGIVHPVDLDHSDNPPSHPELLDLLTDEFISHHFDTRWLVREIVLSKTWQRSSRIPADIESPAPATFQIALERPLSAEQLLDSVLQATGCVELVTKAKPESPDGDANSADDSSENSEDDSSTKLPTRSELKAGFTAAFANEAREPEGEFSATVKGALFWRNANLVQSPLRRRPGNLVDRLIGIDEPETLIDELYLSVLSRQPAEDEVSVMKAFLDVPEVKREAAIRDAAWALLTSIEFYVNH